MRINTVVALLALVFAVNAFAAQRVVVVEEFTGTW
jgi:hypothetical protein